MTRIKICAGPVGWVLVAAMFLWDLTHLAVPALPDLTLTGHLDLLCLALALIVQGGFGLLMTKVYLPLQETFASGWHTKAEMDAQNRAAGGNVTTIPASAYARPAGYARRIGVRNLREMGLTPQQRRTVQDVVRRAVGHP